MPVDDDDVRGKSESSGEIECVGEHDTVDLERTIVVDTFLALFMKQVQP